MTYEMTTNQAREAAYLIREALFSIKATAAEFESADDLQPRYADLRAAYLALTSDHMQAHSQFATYPILADLIASDHRAKIATEGFFS